MIYLAIYNDLLVYFSDIKKHRYIVYFTEGHIFVMLVNLFI